MKYLQKLNAAVEFLIKQNTFKKSLSDLYEAINQSSERFVWSVIAMNSIKNEPDPGGLQIWVVDPSGNLVELFQPKRIT